MYKSLTSLFEEKPEASYLIQGFKTGFRSLDYALDGIKETDLVLIVAKTGNHGSNFLENLAVGLCRQYHVIIINTEKSSFAVAEEIKTIMMAKDDIDHDQGEVSDEQNQMAKNLFIEDQVRFIEDIDETIGRFNAEYHDESIVLIDNLHGLFLSQKVRTYLRQQEEYEISQNLNMLTLKHNIPIILYSRIKSLDPFRKTEPPSIVDIEHLMELHCHFDKILGVQLSEYNIIDSKSDEGSTAYELHIHVLINGDRKRDIVKLNISDSNRFSIFERLV